MFATTNVLAMQTLTEWTMLMVLLISGFAIVILLVLSRSLLTWICHHRLMLYRLSLVVVLGVLVVVVLAGFGSWGCRVTVEP